MPLGSKRLSSKNQKTPPLVKKTYAEPSPKTPRKPKDAWEWGARVGTSMAPFNRGGRIFVGTCVAYHILEINLDYSIVFSFGLEVESNVY